jgi:hypothetical protein
MMTGSVGSRESSSSAAKMLFIVSSNVEKVDQDTRKLIRSHVMQGKKQKRFRAKSGFRTTSAESMKSRNQAVPIKLVDVITTSVPLLPGRIGSDLCFFEFRDEVEPRVLMNMIKC